MTPHWFCIYSQIGHEFEAWANLAMRGFGVYMPLATRVYRNPRRIRQFKTPLMPRYLFVQAGPESPSDITATRGVQEILPHDLDPQPIPNDAIERLQIREASGEFVFSDTRTGKKKEKIILRSLQELAIYQISGQSC